MLTLYIHLTTPHRSPQWDHVLLILQRVFTSPARHTLRSIIFRFELTSHSESGWHYPGGANNLCQRFEEDDFSAVEDFLLEWYEREELRDVAFLPTRSSIPLLELDHELVKAKCPELLEVGILRLDE